MTSLSPPQPLDFQVEPIEKLSNAIHYYYETSKNTGRLVVMPAGTGKTFVVGEALRRLQCLKFASVNYDIKPARWLVITPAAVKTQFTRVLLKFSVRDFLVTSHMSMTSTFGDGYLTWVSKMVNGFIELEPVWDEDLKPDVIILDESQTVKNAHSQIAKIIKAAIEQGVLVIFVSATPFTKLSETLTTCLGLRICTNATNHRDEMMGFIENYQSYDEYNAAAMARFNDYLVEHNYKIEAHNIKFKHRCFNKCILVDFDNPRDAAIYAAAYDTYLEECAKVDKSTPEGWAAIMVAMLKFQQCAEMLKANLLAREACEAVRERGKQVIIGTNFRDTVDIIKHRLIVNGKVPEKKISLIMGGQNATLRQNYIDRFQRGDTDYCLLTAKSGGAGLSLHHELPKSRPREILVPQMWSAIMLVQFLGRGHRINSLSTTHQRIIWFRNTIEEHVAAKVAPKMRSLREIVYKREQWFDLFTPAGSFDVQEGSEILKKLARADEETTEEGDNIVDSMALEAYENNNDED